MADTAVSEFGIVIPVPEGGNAPEYIVWDPKFDAHAEQIKRQESRLFAMSSISPVLFDPALSTGAIAIGCGTAPVGIADR